MSFNHPYVTDVKVVGFKKIEKNYVYVIHTTWSDGMKFELYRKYGDFFSLQDLLLKLFPEEAGKNDSGNRKIPYLPTIDNIFKLFGRTNSESIMQNRLGTIDYYCQTILLNIGEHVGRSNAVFDFFHPTPNDKQQTRLGRPATLHPLKIPAGNLLEDFILIADYEAEPDKRHHQLSAKADDLVVVLKKDDSGWYLCNTKSSDKVGWIPAAFLKKKVDLEGAELGFAATVPTTAEDDDEYEKYHAICEFEGEGSGLISFHEGDTITVIDKDEDGWWFVSFNGREGWAPSSYLEPVNGGLPSISADELDEIYLQEQERENDADDTVFSPKGGEVFYAKQDYQQEFEDELSFTKGAAIEVINRSISGWWTGRLNGKIGVVPSTYLSAESPLVDAVDDMSCPQSQTSSRADSRPNPHSALLRQPTKILSIGPKYDKPPPRRKTVRHTIMLQKHKTK